MEIGITSDPLNILTSTKKVVDNSRYVKINYDKIPILAQSINKRLKQGLESPSDNFGTTGGYENDVQLIFVEDVVNFCFWEEKGKEKWFVEWNGQQIRGGWYALKACFDRALKEGTPILNSNYLKNFGLAEAESFFRSSNGISIPMIMERIENLREAGDVLVKKYDGKFINLLEEASFDAIEVVQCLIKDFSSFRDIAEIDGEKIYFLKRAQILAFDLSYLDQSNPKRKIKNIDKLTAFADYKIPQMLRMSGVLEYSKELRKEVDDYSLILAGSRKEVEIRSAGIWGIELIRRELDNRYTAGEIDNALWLISQKESDNTKPYHRTYSIFY
ncbi:hypothetical protein C4544_02760 [candidate division WS5 bacterium]|uniref:Queuosine 5'-phosphate N-glycosylase/hydrolase n=1 Tax=candidate division WS5 bacterium TaxID=2093353 RepID=A0A419DE81_9BACT|nr:MAG: hypothetical protein C4544_02760 [candidate division WS5 bacterium]